MLILPAQLLLVSLALFLHFFYVTDGFFNHRIYKINSVIHIKSNAFD